MLNIVDEVSPLTDLCVCRGDCVPEHSGYENTHPEFQKYHITPWNRSLLLQQQDAFFDLLTRHGVRLHVLDPASGLPWQMYTRDTGFVIHDKLFYCEDRGLPERVGEIDTVRRCLPALSDRDLVRIENGRIEGGDVLVHQGGAFVGLSARTTRTAVDDLRRHVEVVPLELGPSVMHLDTRMTILPKKILLIYRPAFTAADFDRLSREFECIEVTEEECIGLATNVFCINPETIVLHSAHTRIAGELSARGFAVETVDYSEPIAISGSFRCTTMPLARA